MSSHRYRPMSGTSIRTISQESVAVSRIRGRWSNRHSFRIDGTVIGPPWSRGAHRRAGVGRIGHVRRANPTGRTAIAACRCDPCECFGGSCGEGRSLPWIRPRYSGAIAEECGLELRVPADVGQQEPRRDPAAWCGGLSDTSGTGTWPAGRRSIVMPRGGCGRSYSHRSRGDVHARIFSSSPCGDLEQTRFTVCSFSRAKVLAGVVSWQSLQTISALEDRAA